MDINESIKKARIRSLEAIKADEGRQKDWLNGLTTRLDLKVREAQREMDSNLQSLDNSLKELKIATDNIAKEIPAMNERISNSIRDLPSKKDTYLAIGLPIALTGFGILIIMIGDRLNWWSG